MSETKKSYTLSCPSTFRDAVFALAARQRVNAADIARSVMVLVPAEDIQAYIDPGEPIDSDRDIVVLKSGQSAERPWKRKPRLQVRLPSGLDITFIRKSLNLALAIDCGEINLHVGVRKNIENLGETAACEEISSVSSPMAEALAERDALYEEIERLQATVSALAFDPLPEGITSRAEALHILGFPPRSCPDTRMIKLRFRMLATVHHPDSPCGSHRRMTQLNEAMGLLCRSEKC